MRLQPVLALLLVAALSGAAPAAAQAQAQEAALAPLEVALRDLPDIIRLALNESERRLLSDVAQGRLAEELAYVRGFSALPPGAGGLREADVRAAYAWLEAVVETVAAIPTTFDDSQRAGATCRAAFAGVPADDPKATITLGMDAVDRLAILRAELEALLAVAPTVIDVRPLADVVDEVQGYTTQVLPGIVDCLEELAAQEGSVPRVPLKAVVLPATTFPTGNVRVIGTAPAGAVVRVAATSLAFDAGPGLVKGAFKQPIQVPRAAALADHAITVTAGDLRVDLVLRVAKAPVLLTLQAPTRVTTNTTFAATATIATPAGLADVDRVPVTLTWRASETRLTLTNATASTRLPAGGLGTFVLTATFPGSGILAADGDERTIEVVPFVPAEATASRASLRVDRDVGAIPLDWFWWILLGVLAIGFGLALYMSPVALHRLRGERSSVLRGTRPPPRWPGATTLAAAVGALFAMLRRLGLVPPGRTVQEWVRSTKGPQAVADQFDAVRYGEAPETPATQERVPWVKTAWERWAKR